MREHSQRGQADTVEARAPQLVPGKSTLAEGIIQRKAAPEADVHGAHEGPAAGGGGGGAAGHQMPEAVQDKMERSMGADFSDVRVHEGHEAHEQGAHAFAQGTDIHFAPGQYDPHSQPGQELLGHELAHVVQQAEGRVKPEAEAHAAEKPAEHAADPAEAIPADVEPDAPVQSKGGGVNQDASLEAEADVMGAKAARGEPARGGGTVQPSSSAQPKQLLVNAALGTQELTAGRNAAAEAVADAEVSKLKVELNTSTLSALNGQDRGALRTRLNAAAKTEVSTQIDAAGGSAGQISDAKTHAAELALVGDPVTTAISTKAGEIVEPLANNTKAAFKTAAATGWDTAPKTHKKTLTDLLAVARSKAVTAAGNIRKVQTTAAKALLTTQITQSKVQIEADLTAKTKTNVGTKGTDEATKRNDPALNTKIDSITGNAIKPAMKAVDDEIQKHLETEIGAHGAGYFRSKELKAFRKKMKDAARAKAKADVHTQIAAQAGGQGPASQRYLETDADARTYDMAKESVNTRMVALATEGTAKALTDAGATSTFTEAARPATWNKLRTAPDEAAALQAAITAAKTKVGSVTEAAKIRANAWKNAFIYTAGAAQDAAQNTEATKVETQVATDEVGKKAVKQSIKANSAEEGLGVIGTMVDAAVPNAGDAVQMQVEVTVPIPNTPGAFVLFTFTGDAARERDQLKVGAELQFGAGIEVWGLKADGSIGFFLRAAAKDTDKAMKAFSYGAYRAATSVSEKLAYFWSGKGEGTGKSNVERSEMWAAMVEEQSFAQDPKAFVEIGASARARAALKAGTVEGKGELRGEVFKHHDAASIRASAPALAGLGDAGPDEAAARARMNAIKGDLKKVVKASAEASFEAGGQKIMLGGGLTYESGKDWEVELGCGLELDSTTASSGMDKIASGIVGGSLGIAKTLAGLYQAKDKAEGTRIRGGMGAGAEILGDSERVINASLGNAIGQKLSEAYQIKAGKGDQVNETMAGLVGGGHKANEAKKAGFGSKYGLKVAIVFGAAGGEPTFKVQISEVTERKLGISGAGAGAEITAKTTKRLGAFGTEGGHAFAEGLGFRTPE